MGSTTPPFDYSNSTTTSPRSSTTSKKSTPAYLRSARKSLKATPPSSTWKETLKHSCLQRARRKKSQAISRLRFSPSSVVVGNSISNNSSDAVRQVVQEELRESGVAVLRGALSDEPMMMDLDEKEEGEYAISEAELYKLMQEVEEELQRDGKFYNLHVIERTIPLNL